MGSEVQAQLLIVVWFWLCPSVAQAIFGDQRYSHATQEECSQSEEKNFRVADQCYEHIAPYLGQVFLKPAPVRTTQAFSEA